MSTGWLDPITIFTLFLVIATGILAYIAWRQDQTNRTVQRAYVKIATRSSGLAGASRSSVMDLALSLKNFGETPATITEFVLDHKVVNHGDPLPIYPKYPVPKRKTRIFLVRGQEYTTYWTFTVLSEELRSIDVQEMDLCIYGYVDYIDQFGTRHRAGYARHYDPRGAALGEGSNLNHITQPHYNYDRKRGQGEWHD